MLWSFRVSLELFSNSDDQLSHRQAEEHYLAIPNYYPPPANPLTSYIADLSYVSPKIPAILGSHKSSAQRVATR